MKYPVTEIFRSLQGEGHHAGEPMTFVRLAGCSVRDCAIRRECDEAPWRATATMSASEIGAEVARLEPFGGTVCVTGGEPTDHDLNALVSALWPRYSLHIETSGARVLSTPFDFVTVSPKTVDYAQREGDALKIVIRPEWDQPWGRVRALVENTCFQHHYLQPLYTEHGAANLASVIAMLLSKDNDRGWRLSTQAHKAWGLS